jgi:AraC-like DNA-binding protein
LVNAAYEEEQVKGKLAHGVHLRVKRLQNAFGMSTSTLHNLLKDGYEAPPPGFVETHDRDVLMPSEDEQRIRPAFIRLLKKKIRPTVKAVLAELRAEEESWKWSQSTTYRSLRRIGFVFDEHRKTYYDRMRESSYNLGLRSVYLQQFFDYESEGRQIVYMDESWINKNDTPRRVWHDETFETVDAVPPGKGPRWIVIGAGSRLGWVPNSFRMWKGVVPTGARTARHFSTLVEKHHQSPWVVDLDTFVRKFFRI